MVTYGGMSRQPVTLNTADFIFKNFKAVGFWLTSWRKENPDTFKETIQALCGLIGEKKFLPPKCEEFNLKEYETAFKRYQTKFLDSKILFTD
jgi:mitochondrial enoyl-[acyl-carrier protein] reductase / trans-2-enoyl-CoA reductase